MQSLAVRINQSLRKTGLQRILLSRLSDLTSSRSCANMQPRIEQDRAKSTLPWTIDPGTQITRACEIGVASCAVNTGRTHSHIVQKTHLRNHLEILQNLDAPAESPRNPAKSRRTCGITSQSCPISRAPRMIPSPAGAPLRRPQHLAHSRLLLSRGEITEVLGSRAASPRRAQHRGFDSPNKESSGISPPS